MGAISLYYISLSLSDNCLEIIYRYLMRRGVGLYDYSTGDVRARWITHIIDDFHRLITPGDDSIVYENMRYTAHVIG